MQDKVKVDRDELIALLEAALNGAPDWVLRVRQMQYSLGTGKYDVVGDTNKIGEQ